MKTEYVWNYDIKVKTFGKIANGEEVPYRIKYNGRIYEYAKEIEWYLREDLKAGLLYDINKSVLNKEVEIIEEDYKIEKLGYCEENTFSVRQTGMTKEDRRLLDSNFKEIGNKINEIIEVLNEAEH